jgi:uncharacterized membrane protein YeiH
MLLYVLDLAGVAVFAVSGVLVAARKRLDVLGVVVIAAVTAIGGGTLRDLLLDRNPIFWIADPAYLLVIVASALLALAWNRYTRVPPRALLVADAGGLALFAISGAQIAMQQALPVASVVLMGTLSGCAGGVLRDVICNELPLILHREIYASAAIAGILAYIALLELQVAGWPAALAGMAVVLGLRLGAAWRGLHMPVPGPGDGAER